MNRILSKIILILGLLLTVELCACELSMNQATDIALEHLGNNSDEFANWFDDQSSFHVQERVEQDGFYDEEHNLFFFPLLTIRDRYIKGSLWIEVMCSGTARTRYYLEEI